LAVDLALRGPKTKDRRFGSKEKKSTASVQISGVKGVGASDTLSVQRTLTPKHAASTTPAAFAGLAEIDSGISGLLKFSEATFDIESFLGKSDKDQLSMLLKLAGHVDIASYASIAPDVTPFPNESASSWIDRAIAAKRIERNALNAEKNTAQKAAIGVHEVAERFDDSKVPGLRERLQELKDGVSMVCDIVRLQEELTVAQERVTAVDAKIAETRQKESPKAAQQESESVLQEQLAKARQVFLAAEAQFNGIPGLEKKCDSLTQQITNVSMVRSLIEGLLVRIETLAASGKTDEVISAARTVKKELAERGYPDVRDLQTALRPISSALKEAKGVDLEAIATAGKRIKADLEALQTRNIAASKAEAEHRAWVSVLETQEKVRATQQARVTEVEGQIAAFGDTSDVDLRETLKLYNEEEAEILVELQKFERITGARDVQNRTLLLAKEISDKLEMVKAVEKRLEEARIECLQKTLGPIRGTMQPFCDIINGKWDLGKDSPLGISRDGEWIDIEALSSAERAVFGAGLALSLTAARPGGVRLVMLDNLGWCTASWASKVLDLCQSLVDQGKLDQVLATFHADAREQGPSVRSDKISIQMVQG